MSSVCAEHHYHYQHPLFSQDQLIIPPRKLFTRTSSNFFQQPKLFSSTIQEIHKQPQQEQENYNVDEEETDDDDDDDPFATDEFRMYEFKVRRCMRSRSHDWTDCPFAHPGEKARRRDPRRFHYGGDACPDFRRGSCPRGDNCEFAHGVFECWLHPARYRTHACKDGKNCKRKVCFFAHSPRELRVLAPSSSSSSSSSSCYFKQCCCCGLSRNNGSSSSNHSCINCSPTSTLMGISHLMSSPTMSPTFMSPPSSPCVATSLVSVKSGGIGRKSGGFAKVMSNKSAVLELARSFKAKEISGNNTACSNGDYQLSWSDDRLRDDHEEQFVLSPYCTTPIKGNSIINNVSSAGSRSDIFSEDNNAPISNGGGGQFPDLDWVNELVM